MPIADENCSLPVADRCELDAKVVDLAKLSIANLRAVWLECVGQLPPKRMSRDLMVRGIAYKLQEHRFGGLSKSALRTIARLQQTQEFSDKSQPVRSISMKPGSKLIRDWRGTTHTVLVLDNGYEWQGELYRSLTHIANAITGAHWSGPRFFGLAKRAARRVPRRDILKNAQT